MGPMGHDINLQPFEYCIKLCLLFIEYVICTTGLTIYTEGTVNLVLVCTLKSFIHYKIFTSVSSKCHVLVHTVVILSYHCNFTLHPGMTKKLLNGM